MSIKLRQINPVVFEYKVGIGTTNPSTKLEVCDTEPIVRIRPESGATKRTSSLDFWGTFYNNDDTGARRVSTIKSGFDVKSGWGGEFMSFHVGKDGEQNEGVGLPIERVRINGAGNVCIGTKNDALYNSAGEQARLVVCGESNSISVPGNNRASIVIVNTNITALNTAGLHFARADTDDTPNFAGASIVAQFGETQTDSQYPSASLFFLTSSAHMSPPSTKMVIAAGGNLGIGTTTPTYQLQLATDSAAKPTSTLWTVASDARIKTDITSINCEFALSRIESIRPVSFRFTPEYLAEIMGEDKLYYNFIAQELEQTFPECIIRSGQKLEKVIVPEIRDENGYITSESIKETLVNDIASVDSHSIIIHLIAAVKELSTKVRFLETKI